MATGPPLDDGFAHAVVAPACEAKPASQTGNEENALAPGPIIAFHCSDVA